MWNLILFSFPVRCKYEELFESALLIVPVGFPFLMPHTRLNIANSITTSEPGGRFTWVRNIQVHLSSKSTKIILINIAWEHSTARNPSQILQISNRIFRFTFEAALTAGILKPCLKIPFKHVYVCVDVSETHEPLFPIGNTLVIVCILANAWVFQRQSSKPEEFEPME